MENYHTVLPWNDTGSLADLFTRVVTTVAGTLVHLFFVLSGYGLTWSRLGNEALSWGAWARERFRKIVVPYWVAVVVTFAVANLSIAWAADGGKAPFSFLTLLAYLAFLRNAYGPAHDLVPAFWFMPVIIGLYVLYPLLLQVLRRAGAVVLMIVSVLVSTVTIALCVHAGLVVDHQNALPLYFVAEFALGMALAWVAHHHPGQFRKLTGPACILPGILLYALSGAMTRYRWLGYGSSTYNDIFEAVGLFLMLMPVCRWMAETFSRPVLAVLEGVSRRSYTMYLVHWVLLAWVLEPVAGPYFRTTVAAIPMLLSSFAFVLFMYLLAEGIARLQRSVSCNWIRSNW